MDDSGLIPPAGSVKWCAGIPEEGGCACHSCGMTSHKNAKPPCETIRWKPASQKETSPLDC